VITEFVFGFQFLLFEQPLPLEYMTFPSLIWASMRFGLRGTTTTTLIIGGIILMNIIFGIGPFVTGNILQSMTLLWLYTNFLAITSMILTTEIEERRKAERGMRHMAEHDHLTHLPNRRALVDSIGQAITHANESGDIFAVLFLDIDRFKIVNDSLGHSTGDQMLTIVSLRLLQCVRQDDVVSRLGGDEFVILLQGIKHVDDIYKVCNSILNSMHKPIYIENHELHSSVSIGVCLYPNDGENAEALLKHADIAMYRAKDVGRNNFKFYAPEMNQNVDARLAIENELRYALGKKEFLLHYQPQYHVLDGRIKGAEALLRWCKKDEMCVGPDIFIPVLEETGQIKEVGAWVIEEACRQLSEWNKCGWDHLRMSVNVSSYQLSDVQLPEKIAASLKRYQIDPMNLELEITESMLVRQDDIVEDVIQRLVALGVRMAVDDFGTGYSSLSYLHRLSIDTLKVDRSFVEKIPGNANSEAIAKAIVGLAKSLQLEVVAEGVERQEQCDFISLLGCDYVQGFLLSKPVSAKDFTRLLEKDSDSTLKFAR
jgi:diguanylate cyclase (GGDEF)-like protein